MSHVPFPLTVTGVTPRFCTLVVGVAAAHATRAAAKAVVFMVLVFVFGCGAVEDNYSEILRVGEGKRGVSNDSDSSAVG